MKKPNFKAGDKVFAKVKGYPPWPARIVAENGKKYNVEFYGTKETGLIKIEDLFYYLKNKDKFKRTLKRQDYIEAFEQIEEAIKEDGGDGDNSTTGPDDSINNDSNVSLNVTEDTPDKGVKRGVKRRKSSTENTTPTVKKSLPRGDNEGKVEEHKDETQNDSFVKPSPPKKSPKTKKDKEEVQKTKELKEESVDLKEDENHKSEDNVEIAKDEKIDTPKSTVEIVSEKFLKNNIAFAKYVKEHEAYYKDKPMEMREDYANQVFPVKLPSGIMGGIKLHMGWPLKFKTEYERAVYDESVALRVLEFKLKIDSGDQTIVQNHELFVQDIKMVEDDVNQALNRKEVAAKQARIDRLKIETELSSLDAKIKNCLGLDKADPKEALEHLDALCDIKFDDLMLKKHTHTVEMVRRLRKYVGNTKEWNMTEESLSEFSSWAEKLRAKAEEVYNKFKNVIKLPENSSSFWDSYLELVGKFREECADLSETEVYVLCAEPKSRQAFFDRLEEPDSENVSTD